MPRVNIYISTEALKKIDSDRGEISRSAYLVTAALMYDTYINDDSTSALRRWLADRLAELSTP